MAAMTLMHDETKSIFKYYSNGASIQLTYLKIASPSADAPFLNGR